MTFRCNKSGVTVLGRAQRCAGPSEGAGLCRILGLPGAQLHAKGVCPCGPVQREQCTEPQRFCKGADLHSARACMELHMQPSCCTDPRHRSAGRRAVPRPGRTGSYLQAMHAEPLLHPLLQRCAMCALCTVLCRTWYMIAFHGGKALKGGCVEHVSAQTAGECLGEAVTCQSCVMRQPYESRGPLFMRKALCLPMRLAWHRVSLHI